MIAPAAPILRLAGASYHYGSLPALSDISMTADPGEWVGLIGPNSAGKSTLLRLVSGILPAQRGRVEILGRTLGQWSVRDLARVVAMVSVEEAPTFPFSVEQAVLMGRTPHRAWGWRDRPSDLAVARQAMAQTDVLALRERSIDQLSSGERQRVLLARALAQEPQILLLDEPTAHLDLGHQWSFFELLRDLHRGRRVTVLCAIHDLSLAARYCERLMLLKAGRILAQGSAREVLTPAHLACAFGQPVDVQWHAARSVTIQPSHERTLT